MRYLALGACALLVAYGLRYLAILPPRPRQLVVTVTDDDQPEAQLPALSLTDLRRPGCPADWYRWN